MDAQPPASATRSVRISPTPTAYKVCDGLTEALLYVGLVFGTWALGSVRYWAVWAMSGLGFALGVILVVKWILRKRMDYEPPRWNHFVRLPSEASPAWRRQRWITRMLAGMTLVLLGWSLVSALNARAKFLPHENRFEYFEAIRWLPHSYDVNSTWYMFLSYLGLAGTFWAARDWLLGKSARERRRIKMAEAEGERLEVTEALELPDRLKRLLWVLVVNGALLSLVCLLQRLSGTDKLLWLDKPRFGTSAEHFGPWAYRGNGAQYFNLLWPVCLAFWWSVRANYHRTQRMNARSGGGPHVLLVPLVGAVAAAPFISFARGGMLLAMLALPTAVLGLIRAGARMNRRALGGILVGIVLMGGLLVYAGWQSGMKRFGNTGMIMDTYSVDDRLNQYERTFELMKDHPVLGVGPCAYWAAYSLYLRPKDAWYPMAHSDWLQLVAEWGAVGFSLILLALLIALTQVFTASCANPAIRNLLAVGWVATLAYAVFDFPFQIHSICFLFFVLLAVGISLPARREK